jgi:transposase
MRTNKKKDTVIKIIFTEADIHQLREMYLHHPHHCVQRRALALLLKSYEIGHSLIAKILEICENTLRSYCKAYMEEGIKALSTLNFRKPEGQLVQFERIIKDYITKTPPSSVKQACAEIAKLTNTSLKETQMRRYLKSLGVKLRKVGSIPAKANIAQQQEFLEKELKPRLKQAEDGSRTVYFVDAAHFVLGAFLGYLWTFTRFFIKTPSGRQRYNVLGALNAITKELLTITNATYITSIQVCELLELIASKAIGPVTIVLDNAKYQRCKLVKDKAEKLGIELLFLPPYSPNLNLIERLWKFTKKKCLNSRYYPSFDLFKAAISNFLESIHLAYATDLKTLLALNFQIFTENQFCSIR